MAIATQNSNLVWQKVNNALLGRGNSPGAPSPAAQEAFRDLKKYLAQQKGNVNLQFIPFSAEDIVTNGGYSPDVDACTIYGIYAQGRRTTGTTASFFSANAATDNSATTATLVTARFKAAGQEFVSIHPQGLACETELALSAATAVGGAVESSAADACDGFVIIGA